MNGNTSTYPHVFCIPAYEPFFDRLLSAGAYNMPELLNTIIERCIARSKKPKIAYPTRHHQGEYTIYYAIQDGKLQSATPRAFEAAGLGIIPIAKNGYPIEEYAASVGKNWHTRYGFDDWEVGSWKQSYGLQVYTGTPSGYLTDLDFEVDIVREYPTEMTQTLTELCDLAPSPLILLSKSGGIRFCCKTPDYVHPRTNQDREYIAKWNHQTGKRDKLYLEIFGDKGLSRWDARYEIITGNLFDLPVIDHHALFEIIDNLKIQIHVPPPPKQEKIQKQQSKSKKKPKQSHDTPIIDGLPNDIEWIPTGETDKYKSRRGDYTCQVTEHTKSQGSAQFYKDIQTGEVSTFCHNCRERLLIQAPKQNRTAPDRLHITHAPPPTQDYEDTQNEIKQKLREWEETTRNKQGQHLLNIITPAQTGKTTVTITTIDKLTYITKAKDKATEAYDDAIKAGRDAYLHKSRMFNRGEENWNNLLLGTDEESRPCIHPELCNHIAAAGFSPVKEFCRIQCEQYETCKRIGYLSQTQKERLIDHVYFWRDEAFFADEIYRSRVQDVIGDRDALLAIDEPNPADLTQKRIIDTDTLRQTFNNVKYTTGAKEMAMVLESIIKGLSTAQTSEEIRTALAETITTLSKTDIKQYDEKLSGIPVSFVWYRDTHQRLYAEVIYNNQTRTCFVADDDDNGVGTIPQSILSDGVQLDKLETRFIGLTLFERLGFIDLKEQAHQAPSVYQNLISDIKQFVDSDSHACHRIDGNSIAYYLPPSLNARRGITMNASDTDNLIGEVYSNTHVNVQTITGHPPPWKSGNKLFMISTGRYPPNSLFLFEGKGKDKKCVGIGKTMKDFLHIILKCAEKYKVLVISPKRLQDTEIDPMIAQLNAHQNITLDTHQGAQGKNEYQDRDVVFVFCFEPQPNIVREEVERIYRNVRDLSFKRELEDIVVDGVRLKDVMRYKDLRVQKVYNLLCEKAHMQAIYRLRQALNENKIAILLSAEPVSQIPVTPVKFRKEQLQAFMVNPNWQLSELEQYLEDEAKRTPAEIAKTEGISLRNAYYKSEVTRKQTKAEKKARAKELDDLNVPVAQILAELEISRRTFFNWKDKDFE